MADFEKVFHEHRVFIYKYLFKLCRDETLAEELTQETFFRAYMNISALRDESKIPVWLCQIAKNTYYKYLKTHARETYLEEELHQEQEEKAVSTMVEEKQMTIHIRKVIADLDERSRSIVEYRLFGEKSYKEIGELMEIREATAKVLFSRAKVKIQQQLKEEYGYEI